jgi:hypothetical protein
VVGTDETRGEVLATDRAALGTDPVVRVVRACADPEHAVAVATVHAIHSATQLSRPTFSDARMTCPIVISPCGTPQRTVSILLYFHASDCVAAGGGVELSKPASTLLRNSYRTRTRRTVVAISFVAVTASMFFPWASHGLGSAVSGHQLAALVLEGRADLWVPRWAGAALYVLPLSGSVGLMTLVYEGRTPRFMRALVIGVALALSVATLSVLHSLNLAHIGPGGVLALGGSVAAALTTTPGRKDQSR